MRFVVLAFAVLAALKVWTQDRIYRAAVGGVIATTFVDKAEQACRKAAPASKWVPEANGDVIIGNSAASVALWDFDNPLWEVRFRHPQLVLKADSSETACNYDLVTGIATPVKR